MVSRTVATRDATISAREAVERLVAQAPRDRRVHRAPFRHRKPNEMVCFGGEEF